ncbi:MAG TPA: DUF2905 domain-containing protein [Candidatus Dormibacteraeota bacterium]|nr:DUF2905 domain-containing protein [Candidatus Dormibacteraeota bacterium]
MEPARELGKGLLILGLVIAVVGATLLDAGKLPFRIGRLPGDISYHGRHATFYFPIVTCIVISIVLTLLFWVFGSFRK